MELFKDNFLYFRKELLSLEKENCSEKNSHIFPKKLFLYFRKQNFLYFLKNVFLIFPEMELSSLKNKKFQGRTF